MNKTGLILLSCVVVLLQGCAVFQSSQDRAEAGWDTVTVASFDQMKPMIDPYLGMDNIGVVNLIESEAQPKPLIEQAWQSLNAGDYKKARALLGQVFYIDHDNKEAIALNNQISADIDVYAQKNGFDLVADKTVYLAKEGDSLRKISEQEYGTDTYFPFLMRLNTLPSSTLAKGDIVWVPRKVARPSAKKASQKPIPNNNVDKSKTLPSADKNTDIGELDPNDAQIKNISGLSELEVKALSALRKGNQKESYLMLRSEANLSADGQKTLNDLKAKLIDQPYLRGISNYQSQNLRQAIIDFDEVLSVDPNHTQASLYRARCVRLLEKLKTIN
ncbi:hypothetical protein [Marinomonas fungiae]|uniref:LysM peptidoglycan-binding domain-containing protein n=1 Tax=Marinomonas fungiae TaxID=1137284 RepID=UPI003A93D8A4